MTENIKMFFNKHPVIFKKYSIIKELSQGAFASVYIGKNMITKKEYAIKIQEKSKDINLQSELYRLYNLKGFGIPKIQTFGEVGNYQILIQQLLGKSLLSYVEENELTYGELASILIQIVERLESIHNKGYIHRDIKPNNFMFGKEDKDIVYLIDFGLSKKIISDRTKKHIKFGYNGKLVGTIKFSSEHAMKGYEQSRRDDLISLGYMIIFLTSGYLPWDNIKAYTKKDSYLKTYEYKKNLNIDKSLKDLPSEFKNFIRYTKQLNFSEKPNYKYISYLFEQFIKKNNQQDSLTKDIKIKFFKPKKKRSVSIHRRLKSKIELNLKNITKEGINIINAKNLKGFCTVKNYNISNINKNQFDNLTNYYFDGESTKLSQRNSSKNGEENKIPSQSLEILFLTQNNLTVNPIPRSSLQKYNEYKANTRQNSNYKNLSFKLDNSGNRDVNNLIINESYNDFNKINNISLKDTSIDVGSNEIKKENKLYENLKAISLNS